ncbi:MAG: hypothetical protein R3253_08290, partial [Longimicrobiales bacterium]|nr:hypothetical protein [Longimicrobiales bacterium]
MSPDRALCLSLAAMLLAACSADAPEASADADSSGPAARLVVTVEGFAGPEAVKYDPEQDVYFVANFGPSGEEQRDANGFISRVGADGEVLDLGFMTRTGDTALHMPRGMALSGDTLWVADVDGVHGFHRMTAEPLAFIDFRSLEPGFLNDIALAPDGTLHVTDTGQGRVYAVVDGAPSVAVEDDRTGPPNGITWDTGRAAFLLAPWGGGQVIRSWSPGSGFQDVVTVDGGDFDGIEVVGGTIVAASQNDSTLWLVES